MKVLLEVQILCGAAFEEKNNTKKSFTYTKNKQIRILIFS